MANKIAGYVYLLHFEKPICSTHPAQHYVGWTKVLKGESKGQKITNVFALCAKIERTNQLFCRKCNPTRTKHNSF